MFSVETLTGFTFTGIATRNAATTVSLPIDLQVQFNSDRNKGIRVKAEGDKKIVVYGLNYRQFTSDAFVALPCDQLPVMEYEYYGLTYQGVASLGLETTILLVGCEDDTTVTIPTGTITLGRQDTYLVASLDDLTGTRIVSNKPISVFPGHVCTYVPASSSACDHLTEQVPPTATWGNSFLMSSFLGRFSGELCRILAALDSTNVTFNCTTFSSPLEFQLDPGSAVEIATATESFCSIVSDGPILVMEFGLGNSLDGIGDPFMAMIPPIEQYSNNYIFTVLPDFATNYISVFIAPQHFQSEQIFLDGANLQNATWTPVYCNNVVCGYITRIPLDADREHSLYHADLDGRIGVLAYGFNSYNSYGYPGGLQLSPIQGK